MRGIGFIGVFVLMALVTASATPVRIIGMSSIELLFEDESNMINLYDFGGNVAGLCRDERGSSAEGFLSYGRVSYSDSSGALEPEITRWGGFLPTDASVSVNTFTALGGLPVGGVFTYRSPQGYAAVAKGMYSSTSTHYESSNRTDDATSPLFGAAFARNFGLYDAGIGGEYSSIKVTNNQDDTEINASMKGVGGGFGAQISPMFTFGLHAGMGFPSADLTVVNTDNNFSGSAFEGGIQGIAKFPGIAKVGAKLNFINANLGGEATSGNVTIDLGDLHFSDIGFDVRALFASALVPFRAGAMLGYETFHPEFRGEGTSLFDIDMQITTLDFGVGCGYALPFITPGFQFDRSNQSFSDEINDVQSDATEWNLRFGGESKLTVVTLRGGYSMGKRDPDTDTDDDEMSTRSISLGGTISIPLQPFKIEMAYVNTETKPDDNPTDTKEVDNSFFFAFKMKL